MTKEDAIKHLDNMKWLLGVNNTTVDDIPLTKVIDDIIALLKAQEARVMTLDEVRQAEINSEPLWCELIDCAFGSWRIGWILKTQSRREVYHVIENHFERAIVWESEYGIGWRCWTSRPDEKRRAETPWN